MLKISADDQQDCFFRFFGDKAERESLKVQQLLKTELPINETQLSYLNIEHLEKLARLHAEPQTLQKFRDLVINAEIW